jgi:hypothetical protein
VSRRDAEARDPVNVEPALRAVEDEVLELSLEISLHLQELQAEHLGVDDQRIGPAVSDVDRLVDELLALAACMRRSVTRASPSTHSTPSPQADTENVRLRVVHGVSFRPYSSEHEA